MNEKESTDLDHSKLPILPKQALSKISPNQKSGPSVKEAIKRDGSDPDSTSTGLKMGPVPIFETSFDWHKITALSESHNLLIKETFGESNQQFCQYDRSLKQIGEWNAILGKFYESLSRSKSLTSVSNSKVKNFLYFGGFSNHLKLQSVGKFDWAAVENDFKGSYDLLVKPLHLLSNPLDRLLIDNTVVVALFPAQLIQLYLEKSYNRVGYWLHGELLKLKSGLLHIFTFFHLIPEFRFRAKLHASSISRCPPLLRLCIRQSNASVSFSSSSMLELNTQLAIYFPSVTHLYLSGNTTVQLELLRLIETQLSLGLMSAVQVCELLPNLLNRLKNFLKQEELLLHAHSSAEQKDVRNPLDVLALVRMFMHCRIEVAQILIHIITLMFDDELARMLFPQIWPLSFEGRHSQDDKDKVHSLKQNLKLLAKEAKRHQDSKKEWTSATNHSIAFESIFSENQFSDPTNNYHLNSILFEFVLTADPARYHVMNNLQRALEVDAPTKDEKAIKQFTAARNLLRERDAPKLAKLTNELLQLLANAKTDAILLSNEIDLGSEGQELIGVLASTNTNAPVTTEPSPLEGIFDRLRSGLSPQEFSTVCTEFGQLTSSRTAEVNRLTSKELVGLLVTGEPTCVLASLLLVVQRCKDEAAANGLLRLTTEECERISKNVTTQACQLLSSYFKQSPHVSASWVVSNHEFLDLSLMLLDEKLEAGLTILIGLAHKSPDIMVTGQKINKKLFATIETLLKSYPNQYKEAQTYLAGASVTLGGSQVYSIEALDEAFKKITLCTQYLRMITGSGQQPQLWSNPTKTVSNSPVQDSGLEIKIQTLIAEVVMGENLIDLKENHKYLDVLLKDNLLMKFAFSDSVGNPGYNDLTPVKRLAVSTAQATRGLISLFEASISSVNLPYISNLGKFHKLSTNFGTNFPSQAVLGGYLPVFEICAHLKVFPQNLRFYLEQKPFPNQEGVTRSSAVCSTPSISQSLSEGMSLLQHVTAYFLPQWELGYADSWGDGFNDKKMLESFLFGSVIPLLYKISKGLECTVTVTQNEKLRNSGQVKSYLGTVEQMKDWYNEDLLPLVKTLGIKDLQPLTFTQPEDNQISDLKDLSTDELSCPELQTLRKYCRSICVLVEDLLAASPQGLRYIESFDRLNALKRKKSKLDEHLEQKRECLRHHRQNMMSRYERIQSLQETTATLQDARPPLNLQQFKAVCEVYELKKLEWFSQEGNSFIRFLEEHPEDAEVLLTFIRHNLEGVFGDQLKINMLTPVFDSVGPSCLKPGYFGYFITQLLEHERVYQDQMELLEIALRHSQILRKVMIAATGIKTSWKNVVNQVLLIVTQMAKFLAVKTFHDEVYHRYLYVFESSIDFLINVFEQNNTSAKYFSIDKTSRVKWTGDKSASCLLQTTLEYIRMFLDQSDLAQTKFGGWLGPSDKPEHFKLLNGFMRLLLELASGPCLVVQESIPQEYLEAFIALIGRVVLDVNSPYYEYIALPAAAFLETFTEESHRAVVAGAASEEENLRADRRISLLAALLKSKELETIIVRLIKKLVIYSKLKSDPFMKQGISEKLKQDLQKKIELYKTGKYAPAQVDHHMQLEVNKQRASQLKERKSESRAQQQKRMSQHYQQEEEMEMEDQYLFGMDDQHFLQEQQQMDFQQQEIMPMFYEDMARAEEESEPQFMQQKAGGMQIELQPYDVNEQPPEVVELGQKESQPVKKLEYLPEVDLFGLTNLKVKKQDIFLDQTTQKLYWLESLQRADITTNFGDNQAVILDDLNGIQRLSWKPQELIDLYTTDVEFGDHFLLKTCIQLHTILINLASKNEVFFNEAMNRTRLMFAYYGEQVPRDVLIELELESQELIRFNQEDASDEIKVFLFLTQVTQKIEIAVSNTAQGRAIRQVHFQLHPLCMMLTHETKLDFLESRDPENTLEEMLENQKIFEIEMTHNLSNIRKGKLFYMLALHDNITVHRYVIWTLALVMNWLLMFAARTNEQGAQDYFVFPVLFFNIYAWVIFGYSVTILFFWLSSRYRQNADITRQKLRIQYKTKKLRIRDYIDIYIIRSMLLKSTPQQLCSHIVFALLGIFVHPFFHTLHLLLLVLISKTAFQIVRSITTYPKQLLVTLELAIIVIYIFAYLVFQFYNKDWDSLVDNGGTIEMCKDMWECIFYSVNLGFRSGLGSAFGTPEAHVSAPRFFGRFMFSLTFNILINTVILNIVFGIIIDTFANIRDKMQSRKDYLDNYCVLCKKSRDAIELTGEEFDSHIYSRHYLWKYVNYRVYLSNKNRYDLTTSENMIWRIISEGSTDWIPTEKVLSSIPNMKEHLLIKIEETIKTTFKNAKDTMESTLENFTSLQKEAIAADAKTREGYDPVAPKNLLGNI